MDKIIQNVAPGTLSLSLLIISTMAVLPHFGTDLLAQTPQPSVNEQVTPPLDMADSIYSANTSKLLSSKNISLTPYRVSEGHYICSITDILKKISDDKSLNLFNRIADSDGDTYTLLKEMNLTTKQYYSRVTRLLNTGLIKRHKGKYSITLFGKVVYDAQMIIGKALTYYWKLKAIESVKMSSDVRFPKEELTQLINAMIDNHFIKDILIKEPLSYTFEDHQRHQHQQRKEAKLIES